MAPLGSRELLPRWFMWLLNHWISFFFYLTIYSIVRTDRILIQGSDVIRSLLRLLLSCTLSFSFSFLPVGNFSNQLEHPSTACHQSLVDWSFTCRYWHGAEVTLNVTIMWPITWLIGWLNPVTNQVSHQVTHDVTHHMTHRVTHQVTQSHDPSGDAIMWVIGWLNHNSSHESSYQVTHHVTHGMTYLMTHQVTQPHDSLGDSSCHPSGDSSRDSLVVSIL